MSPEPSTCLPVESVLPAMGAVLTPLESTRLLVTALGHRVVPAAADLAFEGDAIPRHGAVSYDPPPERLPEFLCALEFRDARVVRREGRRVERTDVRVLEPMTGVEPVTSSLPRTRSTN